MARIRTPGVYFDETVRERRDITLGETGVPAFLGVAERGPLNEPFKLSNFSQFKQIYGAPIPGSYLAACVEAFFKNGGKHCFVVRVAHIFRGRGELAKRARYEVLDRDGYPAMDITAASEGSWGNEITLSVKTPEKPRVSTFVTLDVQPDSERATVQSSRGFEAGMQVRFRAGKEERFTVLSRVRGNEIFWRGGLGILFKSAAPTYVEPVEFSVHASTRDKTERFDHLSLSPTATRNYLRVINQESKLVRVRDLESGSEPPLNLPETVESEKLRGGKDGLDSLTPEDFIGYNNGPDARFGLGALEANDDVDLICVPDLYFAREHSAKFKSDREIQAVHRAMIDHCERMGDRFALLDLPEKTTFEQALDWRLLYDTSYAAIYYPWLVVSDRGRRKSLPPVGHIAGVISRTDRDIGVHGAPANKDLEGVVDVSVILREEHLSELNHKGINCVRSFPVRGIRPWGARTLSSAPEWRYIPTRRIFCAIRRAIYENTQWVVFEPNDSDLRGKVKSSVENFLRLLWSSGYFVGDKQNDAFFVQCNEENNANEDIEEGRLSVDIGVAPARPAEFIYMRLEHTVEDRRLGDLGEL